MEKLNVGVNPLPAVARYLNERFAGKQPAYIIAVTASSVLAGVWLWDIIFQPEELTSRLKKSIFRLLRKIPAISHKVEEEKRAIAVKFEKNARERCGGEAYILQLPGDGLPKHEIIDLVKHYLNQGEYDWKKGFVSGTVYNFDDDLVNLMTEVYGLASYTNPLHSDVFPGVVKMEAEVIKITAAIFHGGPDVCGTMTSGGTESILMAMKAYRDYAKDEFGVKKPEVVLPRTAHPAFDKAAQYFGITPRYISVDPETYKVKLNDVEKAINSNTIVIVGSAPNYPYGTMDDIEALASIATKRKVPLHVDCCLGGFLAPFMKAAGFEFPAFDFSLPAVTSISADPHKYGFAPKGCSVVLYSHPKFRHYQYCVTTDWPGGVYGSPSVCGSRAGGIIAACWATLMYYGKNGYIETTEKIINTTRYIERELRQIKSIFIFGKPATSVVAIGSKEFQILRLGEKLSDRGWSLNPLQFPSGIHICVTYMHTLEGVAAKFVYDVKECVAELMVNPEKPVDGSLAIYGMSQAIPDRSIVGDFTRMFIDSMYLTPEKSEEPAKMSNGHSL